MSRLTHIEGAVLVGGASRRMGRDKASLTLDGAPWVVHVADVLGSCVEVVRVVTRPGAPSPIDLPVVEDRHEARAAMVGIAAALAAARAPWVVVAACDMPLLQAGIVLALCALAPVHSTHDIVAPLGPGGPEPLLALYRTRLLPELERRIAAGELGMQALLESRPCILVPEADLRAIDPDLDSLRNLNRPEDLVALAH